MNKLVKKKIIILNKKKAKQKERKYKNKVQT